MTAKSSKNSFSPNEFAERVRQDFPIFRNNVTSKRGVRSKRSEQRLAFLDSAASAQKPEAVLAAEQQFYRTSYANIHRGVYQLSEAASSAYESARSRVAQFINAPFPQQIVFSANATAAINLVAHGLPAADLPDLPTERKLPGNFAQRKLLLCDANHHANIVPWQQSAQRFQLETLWLTSRNDHLQGCIDLEAYQRSLQQHEVALVAVSHINHVLGIINPLEEIISLAHQYGARVLIDGSQAVAHTEVDVASLGCDFYVFSGHKIYGPSGIGVLYGRDDLLAQLPPLLTGGGMIAEVTKEATSFAPPPLRHEAGTPAIAQAVGLAAALDYLTSFPIEQRKKHANYLYQRLLQQLSEIPELEIYGPEQTALTAGSAKTTGIVSFNLRNVHPHDLATILDSNQVAVRSGHHCAQPLMRRLEVAATVRASLAIYSCDADIAQLVNGIKVAQTIFS